MTIRQPPECGLPDAPREVSDALQGCRGRCFAALTVVTGCWSMRPSHGGGQTTWKPPRVADAADLALPSGYRAEVAACHPGVDAGLAPALDNEPLPRFVVRFQVRHGLGKMRAFDKSALPDRELDEIIDYLKRLRNR